MSSDTEIRERLKTSLDKLAKLKATDLIREDALGPHLSFRAGIPFFERTLTLYRQLANTNLSRVPSAYLDIAANHAEESLHQFEQIEAFTPEGMDRPEQVRNLLINELRDAHANIYEDLSVILIPSREQAEKVPRAASPMPAMLIVVLVLIAAILGYRYSIYDNLIRDLQDLVHAALKGAR